ncbi:MAG: hypothetical protein IKB07_04725 [Lachnospiraceae bacterium]|nr:hypothetical protein [Lachnospiraceae bacterium]
MIPILCFAAVLIIEYKGFRKRTKEYRELEHFAEFLSNLKDQFFLCKNVTESIFRATAGVPGSLRKRLEDIGYRLENDAWESALSEETHAENEKYLRLFLMQCKSAVRYGTGKSSTESVFVRNMTELRRDVQNECEQRKQSMYAFAGMGVVSALPVLFLPLIRFFGTMTMEELKVFYEGTVGNLIVAIFFILTVVCYTLLCLIRCTDRRIYGHSFFLGRNTVRDRTFFLCALIAGGGLGMCSAFVWNTTNFGRKIVTMGCGGIIGLGLVYGCFYYLSYLQNLGKSSEVLNLQAVVLLLMEVPDITIAELLDTMSECAALFRPALLQCADAYVSEDEKALEMMYKAENYPAFLHLAGRILASERIGIKAAFSDVAEDRRFFREQQRLDREEERRKKAANAQVITFLPLLFLLFAYLILPFLVFSFDQMKEIFTEMEQIRIQ